MKNSTKLTLIKTIHTAIYITMVAGIFYILYAGITKTYNIWLYLSLGLLAAESLVYGGNGMRCPFTDMAKKCGDEKGYVGDTFLPERFTRYTFNFFGILLAAGVIILILDYFRVI